MIENLHTNNMVYILNCLIKGVDFGSTNAPPPDHALHAGITLRPENASLASSLGIIFLF